MRLGIIIMASAGLVASALACDEAAPTALEKERLKVVVSLPLFADFVRQVGDERVEVTAMIPTGADPETFEPTPRDIQKLSEAEVVFINGLGLEAALEAVIANNVSQGTAVIRFGDLFEGENPHFWLSVDNALLYAREIAETLREVDPNNAALYRENFEAYKRELASLAQELKDAVSSIPPEQRKLVTTHDAFPYFADSLGLKRVGFVTPSEAQEPSPRDIQRLVTAIRDEKVPAVFSEPGFNDVVLKQVAAEAGVPVCLLYSDAFDNQVQTYIEMMRFNAKELVRCLGGARGY